MRYINKILKPKDICKPMEKPSGWCVSVCVIVFILNFVQPIYAVADERDDNTAEIAGLTHAEFTKLDDARKWTLAIVALVGGLLQVYILFVHCQACNVVPGALWLLGIGFVVQMIQLGIVYDYKS